MTDTPSGRTAFVLLTWDRLQRLRRTLKQFLKRNDQKDNLIIVDNASRPPTQRFLKEGGFRTVRNRRNLGAFGGWKSGYQAAAEAGYEFIVLLPNDVDTLLEVPVAILEKYMDDNANVGFVRLYYKKNAKRVNLITRKRIRETKGQRIRSFSIAKSNQNMSSCPNFTRTTTMEFLFENQPKRREWGLMEKYEKLNLRAAHMRPHCFRLGKQGSHKGGWKH